MPKTILFLSANPLSTDRLRLDEEVRETAVGVGCAPASMGSFAWVIAKLK